MPLCACVLVKSLGETLFRLQHKSTHALAVQRVVGLRLSFCATDDRRLYTHTLRLSRVPARPLWFWLGCGCVPWLAGGFRDTIESLSKMFKAECNWVASASCCGGGGGVCSLGLWWALVLMEICSYLQKYGKVRSRVIINIQQ